MSSQRLELLFFSCGTLSCLLCECYTGNCLSSLPCNAKTKKRDTEMQLNACGYTASTAGGQGEPDPGRKETPLYLQVSLHLIVAQHFFIILILYQCFLNPFWQHYASLGFPDSLFDRGMSSTRVYPTWEIPPCRKSPGSHAHATVLLHPASSHMTQRPRSLPLNQSQKINGV